MDMTSQDKMDKLSENKMSTIYNFNMFFEDLPYFRESEKPFDKLVDDLTDYFKEIKLLPCPYEEYRMKLRGKDDKVVGKIHFTIACNGCDWVHIHAQFEIKNDDLFDKEIFLENIPQTLCLIPYDGSEKIFDPVNYYPGISIDKEKEK